MVEGLLSSISNTFPYSTYPLLCSYLPNLKNMLYSTPLIHIPSIWATSNSIHICYPHSYPYLSPHPYPLLLIHISYRTYITHCTPIHIAHSQLHPHHSKQKKFYSPSKILYFFGIINSPLKAITLIKIFRTQK